MVRSAFLMAVPNRFLDTDIGESGQRRLTHAGGEAEHFYRGLSPRLVRVGMEATGHARWFDM